MIRKILDLLSTHWVTSKALHSFALDLKLQYFVPVFGKGYGHCLHAAPRLAALPLTANSVFNGGF